MRGGDVNRQQRLCGIAADAQEYLMDALGGQADREEEAEYSCDQHGEHVSWDDGMGFSYHGDGQFTSEGLAGSGRTYLERVFDSEGMLVALHAVRK